MAIAIALKILEFIDELPRKPAMASPAALELLRRSGTTRAAVATWMAKEVSKVRNAAYTRADSMAAAQVGKFLLGEARVVDADGKVTFAPGLALRAHEWTSILLSMGALSPHATKKIILGTIGFGT